MANANTLENSAIESEREQLLRLSIDAHLKQEMPKSFFPAGVSAKIESIKVFDRLLVIDFTGVSDGFSGKPDPAQVSVTLSSDYTRADAQDITDAVAAFLKAEGYVLASATCQQECFWSHDDDGPSGFERQNYDLTVG